MSRRAEEKAPQLLIPSARKRHVIPFSKKLGTLLLHTRLRIATRSKHGVVFLKTIEATTTKLLDLIHNAFLQERRAMEYV